MKIEKCTGVISGGASGLGEACVRMLVKAGANAAILDLDEERGEKVSSELGDAVTYVKTDVSDGSSVEAAMDHAVDAFGAIHFAISCAGTDTPRRVVGKDGPVRIEDFNRIIQINLIGTMNVIRLAASKMTNNTPNEDGEKGVIINTASIAAFDGQMGQAAYSASKAGIVGMTLPIAREFASYGIRILTIAPGLFQTPMMSILSDKVRDSLQQSIPFPKRFGHADDFAGFVKHIFENASFNGETIRLDHALRMA